MDTYGAVYRRVLMPAWESMIRKRPTMKRWQNLERSQYRRGEEIEKIQLASLRRVLTHAGDHIPYYRDLFRTLRFSPAEISSVSDLAALPFLTKEIHSRALSGFARPPHACHAHSQAHQRLQRSAGLFRVRPQQRGVAAGREVARLRMGRYRPGAAPCTIGGCRLRSSGFGGAKARLDRYSVGRRMWTAFGRTRRAWRAS